MTKLICAEYCLLVAPLKGLDGKVYAVAQGNLVVGGFGAQGADGSG